MSLLALAVFAGTSTRFFVPENLVDNFSRKYGEQAVRRLNSLLLQMEELIKLPEDQIVIRVNRFFNQLEYCPDIKTWNKKDYWASRLEFLGKGQGDCEDYAVAKFLTMVQLGVPEEKLFLTYVKAVGYPDAAHLVVTYYKEPGTVPFVLDNYIKKILPATQRPDLIPVYSFTASDLYIQKQYGLGKRINRKLLKTQLSLKTIDLEIQEREN
ncbi:transglutaminase-like cysteine peptidase [Desulfobacula sp.]|uniref:transglutaminase-like cysteine peptidase n=1 Tax=Desulfobacula sp. TaxID=2593537 RepID=UPI00271473EA|nr:transglutaminase-like cysteine peptidase [Desulfobacula sp.]